MNVYLTFDVEIWCSSWKTLDADFPVAFDRYVFGRSRHGEWALPKTLEILNRNGLRGVFFVEPLFAERFGRSYLERVVRLIRDAGQEVQLHLHAEWIDEIRPPLIDDCHEKRQHLSYYTPEEQAALIQHGRHLLEQAGSGPITAFRAGSFAVNRYTYRALRQSGILIDSSLNGFYPVSGPDLREVHTFDVPFVREGVSVYPVTLFQDGLNRPRPAQISGSSFEELRDAMVAADSSGLLDFVIVSHNFEMLKPGRSEPDPFVARRFERLCSFLGKNTDRLQTVNFTPIESDACAKSVRPSASLLSTGIRYGEQLARRFA